MKKFMSMLCVGLLSLSLMTGCGKGAVSDKATVYTTINPVYALATEIGGDKLEIKCLASSADAHSYEPTAKDMAMVSGSDLLLYNGLGVDSFVNDIDASVDVESVDTSQGVTPITYDDSHSHDHGHSDHECSDGEFDPHIWLSPKNAKIQLLNIKDAFCKLDPENADYYTQNYNNAVAKLDAIDAKYQNLSSGTIIVEHNAYSYLARDYGFTVEAMDTQSNSDLSPSKMKEVVNHCKSHNISIIYYEEGTSDKNAKAVATEIGGTVEVLNSFDAVKNDKTNYWEVMEQNLIALDKAL